MVDEDRRALQRFLKTLEYQAKLVGGRVYLSGDEVLELHYVMQTDEVKEAIANVMGGAYTLR